MYRKVALRMDFCLRHRSNDTACDFDFGIFAKWENRLCQVVEVDLLDSSLDKIVLELIKRHWCYRGWIEGNSNWVGSWQFTNWL